MLVLMICCVSTVSAADINGTDDVCDDVIGEVIDDAVIDEVSNDGEIDESVDIVEEVNVDDTQDNVVDEENSRSTSTYFVVNSSNVGDYFDISTGEVFNTRNLNFTGTFSNVPFDNFIINRYVNLRFTNALFVNVGFKVLQPGITIDGATFNITAPANRDCYAIDVENANNVKILNNEIYYNAPTATSFYNYVIKVVGSGGVTVKGNTITADLPLKNIDYTQPYPSIYTDRVAGVAVQSSNGFNFTNNTLDVEVSAISGYSPTLDALIIVNSNNSYITKNKIKEIDGKTPENSPNFLYAVDVYSCYNITIDRNVIDLNSDGGNLTLNGTGAAYGIQLSGNHTGVVISNNNITTANNGPNLGIYSQNYKSYSSLTITGNRINVTGRAGTNPYSLVSGMELQDNYDVVSGNIIEVHNIGVYNPSNCVYGISYCQSTSGSHTYIVTGNTVHVNNGKWAVFLDGVINSVVTSNWLYSNYDEGDAVVKVTGSNNSYSGNLP